MDAKEFYTEFINQTNEHKDEYIDIYRNHEPKYTELMNKSIIPGIIKNVYVTPEPEKYEKLVAQNEYFRIDCTGYQHRYYEIDEAEAKSVGLNRHFWDLKIAVEHENDKKDWMDEVIKLTHIRCPLKVIIGYNHCDQRDEGDIAKLQFIAKWMQRVSVFDNNSNEEILIIIGNGAPSSKKNPPYESFDYRGYLFDYQDRQFKRI